MTVYFNLMCVYLVGILLNASTSTDENDAIDIEMQCDMLFTVASLCEGDTHRKVKLWAVFCDKLTTSFHGQRLGPVHT